MTGPIQEQDWKYLGDVHDELLNELCSRILTKAIEIAAGEMESRHKRYLALYRHIKKSDEIVAECFNDWRQATIRNRILSLRHRRLLTEEHVKHLSEKAQVAAHRGRDLKYLVSDAVFGSSTSDGEPHT